MFLSGKCRYHGEKIFIKYPFIELMTGIIFLGIYIKYGLRIETIKFLFLASFLILVGIIDYNSSDVYNETGGIFKNSFDNNDIFINAIYKF